MYKTVTVQLEAPKEATHYYVNEYNSVFWCKQERDKYYFYINTTFKKSWFSLAPELIPYLKRL